MQLPQQYPAFSICPSCIDGPDVLYPRLDVTPRAVVVGAEGGIDEFLEDEEDELDDEDDAQDDADCGDEVEVLDDDEDADDDEDEDEDADRGDDRPIPDELRHNTTEHRGVCIAVCKRFVDMIENVCPLGDRLMHIKLRSRNHLNVVVAYAPTADKESSEKSAFYELLEETVRKIPKHEFLVIVHAHNSQLHVSCLCWYGSDTTLRLAQKLCR